MRVGDGFVRVDADGAVTYASPNALSAFRRLGLTGDLVGQPLAEHTRELVPSRTSRSTRRRSPRSWGRPPRATELENAHAR